MKKLAYVLIASLVGATGVSVGAAEKKEGSKIATGKEPEKLLAAGANVNAATIYGKTALMRAAENDNPELVEKLLAAGADVNATATLGTTALLRAVDKDNPELVEKLLAAGADVNATNSFNWTALEWAKLLGKKHSEVIIKLLEEAIKEGS